MGCFIGEHRKLMIRFFSEGVNLNSWQPHQQPDEGLAVGEGELTVVI